MAVINVTRLHGKNTRILVQIGGTGTQYNLGGIATIDIPRTSDRADTTSFGDGNKTSVDGYGDGDITGSGFYDLTDTVMAAARTSATPSYWWVYPKYETDKSRYYWVPGDVQFGFHSEANAAETLTGLHIFATGSAIDAL